MKKDLGKTGLSIKPLVFGANVFGWTVDDKEAFALLDRFVDQGFSLVDTADVYSVWTGQPGISETIIGRWLKSSRKRDKVLIATKVGMEMGPGKKGLSRKHIEQSLEDSLKRLNCDVIDLYQAHQDDPETPLDETLEAFDRLQKAGKIRYLGASNYHGERLAEALRCSESKDLISYQTLQPHYNLMERKSYEADLEPLILKRGLGVIPYFSLARGFLTGKYRSEADLGKSPRGAGVKAYLDARGMRVLKELDAISADRKATPAQVALAWLIGRPSVTAPIASATSIEQLNDIMKAVDITLSAEERKRLDAASQQ